MSSNKNHYKNGRVESFSDGVFAFAATLLVVSLEVPQEFQLLQKQLFSFIGFGISFFALLLIWGVHYSFFRRINYLDWKLILMNMILLFMVLFFVYPLKFLVTLSFEMKTIKLQELQELFQLYGLGFILIFLCVTLMYWYASRCPEHEEKQTLLLAVTRHYGIFVLVGLLSIITAFLGIGIQYGLPGFLYGLIGPLCYLNGRKTNLGELI